MFRMAFRLSRTGMSTNLNTLQLFCPGMARKRFVVAPLVCRTITEGGLTPDGEGVLHRGEGDIPPGGGGILHRLEKGKCQLADLGGLFPYH